MSVQARGVLSGLRLFYKRYQNQAGSFARPPVTPLRHLQARRITVDCTTKLKAGVAMKEDANEKVCGRRAANRYALRWQRERLGSRSVEEWSKVLDAPARIAGLRIDGVVAHMALKSGERVADIGAGTGVFSLPMATAVLPGGVVYSVEIEQGLLDLISRKITEQHATNVQTVLGKFADPSLPVTDIDVALFHDVLHHIEDRAGYVKALARYLKPLAPGQNPFDECVFGLEAQRRIRCRCPDTSQLTPPSRLRSHLKRSPAKQDVPSRVSSPSCALG